MLIFCCMPYMRDYGPLYECVRLWSPYCQKSIRVYIYALSWDLQIVSQLAPLDIHLLICCGYKFNLFQWHGRCPI